jgi:hypothetical protein
MTVIPLVVAGFNARNADWMVAAVAVAASVEVV